MIVLIGHIAVAAGSIFSGIVLLYVDQKKSSLAPVYLIKLVELLTLSTLLSGVYLIATGASLIRVCAEGVVVIGFNYFLLRHTKNIRAKKLAVI